MTLFSDFVTVDKQYKLMGNILKWSIEESDISQKDLATSLCKSKQTISQMINGRANFSIKVFDDALKALGIDYVFDFSEKTYDYVRSFLKECVDLFYYKDFGKCMKLINSFIDNKYSYSLAAPEYMIILLLKNVFELKESEFKYFDQVVRDFLFETMDEYCKSAYLVITIYGYMEFDDLDESRIRIKMFKDKSLSIDKNICALVNLFDGIIYIYMFKPIEALIAFKNATSNFYENNNYSRQVAILNNCGLSFSFMNKHDMAEKYYFEALKNATILNKSSTLIVTYNNLGILYRDAGKYELAIEYAKKALKLKPDYVASHITVAWSAYKLGMNELAEKHRKSILDYAYITNKEYRLMMADLLEMYILNESSKKIICKLEEMIELSISNEVYIDLAWCLNRIIIECKEAKLAMKLPKYQTQLLELYRLNPKF